MFNNIGGKIKSLASFVCWLGIIATVIGGIILMLTDEDLILIGLLVMIAGSIGSWVGSFLLYGFGQLVHNSDILILCLGSSGGISSVTNPGDIATARKCNNCGAMMVKDICQNCGKAYGEAAQKIETLHKLYSDGIITLEDYQKKMEAIRNANS